jgi:hypothetical protein
VCEVGKECTRTALVDCYFGVRLDAAIVGTEGDFGADVDVGSLGGLGESRGCQGEEGEGGGLHCGIRVWAV